jgi:hypothetical protein
MLKYAEIAEEDFIPIINFLLEDTEEAKKVTTLYQREEEYGEFLGLIEFFIANYFYFDNNKLKDKDVKRALRSLRNNLDSDLDSFKPLFERELVGVIFLGLKTFKRKITKHEFLLVLKYILWSIDNRKYLDHPQAYLNWICDFFHILDEDDKEELDRFYDKVGRVLKIGEDKVEFMKSNDFPMELDKNEIERSRKDSENFEEHECFNKDGCER